MITDSHCHLASSRFTPEEVPDLIARASAAEVSRLISLATDEDDLSAQIDLAEQHPQVWACLGIHPCSATDASDSAMEKIATLLSHPKVVAIGETGLDYYHPAPEGWSPEAYRSRQQDLLEHHFALAAAHRLGIVIHTRDLQGGQSFDDAVAIYRTYADRVCALFHCFIGTTDQAHRVLDLGGLLGFGGVLTFNSAVAVRNVARDLPAGSFVLETDSPYLAPTPHRGKRNEPALLRDTAEYLATIRAESWQELARHTTATANAFFRFTDQPT